MTLVLVIGETGQLARALMAAPSRPGMTLEHTRRSALDLAAPETVEAYVRARRPAAVINAPRTTPWTARSRSRRLHTR